MGWTGEGGKRGMRIVLDTVKRVILHWEHGRFVDMKKHVIRA
jgi:hypothetical protein